MKILTTSFCLFVVFLILITVVFRTLVFNISTNLPDWRDYALSNWIMYQDIHHIENGNFSHFFDTNAFYPNNRYSLLFADTFLPQALIELPFLAVTRNIILAFNITFLIVLILNYLSSFLFWKIIFKKSLISFFGALFVVFSPFFYLEYGHFQILNFWPLFFSLYFLLRANKNSSTRNLIFSGLFLSIQFLASVYISVFLIFIIFIYYLVKSITQGKILTYLKHLAIIFAVFLLICGIFIKGYIDMRGYYNIQRDIREYINYSASLSDYIFTNPINSIVHKSPLMNFWNSFNKNSGTETAFPGFLISILAIYGLFTLKREKGVLSFKINLTFLDGFFLILLLSGFIFSLGPRLKFNGVYSYIPTLYYPLIKIVPFLEAIRAPVRWSFLFYLGTIFFALQGIEKLSKELKLTYLCIGIFIFFIFEYIPFNITTHAETYINSDYSYLKTFCTSKKLTLLEIPVTHLNVVPDIITGVNYISKVELSSTYHNCNLANGYSGYDMPSIFNLGFQLDQIIRSQSAEQFVAILKVNKIDVVKVNFDYLEGSLKEPMNIMLKKLEKSPDVDIKNHLIFLKNSS